MSCNRELLAADIESVLLKPVDETTMKRANGSEDKITKKFQGTVLIADHGKSIFKKSYGLADNSKNIPNLSTNRYEIGSITKQFTAVAILKLQEHRLLNIKDPIAKYLAGVPNETRWQSLSIEDLLTHRSGQLAYFDYSVYPSNGTEINLSQFVNLIFQNPLREPPGGYTQYSNLGYVLLAAVIEAVSGKSYEHFLNDAIFEPTDMTHTGVFIPPGLGHQLSKPHVFRLGAKGENIIKSQEPSVKSFMHGGGDLYSTVDDLLKWHLALLQGKILKPESLSEMFSAKSIIANQNYGYGIQIRQDRGLTIIGHGGKTRGSISLIESSIGGEISVIILANADYYGLMDSVASDLWSAISIHCLTDLISIQNGNRKDNLRSVQ